MYFDPTGPWQKKLLDSSYDSFFLEKLQKMDLTGKAIYDIGAHVGYHSFYFARLVGPKGKIYSFEPHPKNLERLILSRDANMDIKDIVSPFPMALSDKKETLEFTLSDDIESGRSSGGFIEKADTIWSRDEFTKRAFRKTLVQAIPLDQAMTELHLNIPPTVMKIDVEGAEALVLKGASDTIKKYKPVLMLEVHSPQAMIDVTKFLNDHSYVFEILKEEKDGRKFMEAKPR